MKTQVAVSFEDDLVKVVFASQRKGETVIRKTLALHDKDFDAFLKKERLPNLCIVYPFRSFFCETMTVPPVKDKYLKTFIQLEIKKRFPHLEDFSFFYTVLADKHSDEKGSREIFFYAVANDEINRIVDRFDRQGRTVTAFFPDILPLSRLGLSMENAQTKTALYLLASDTGKTLFLVKDGLLRFARITSSALRNIQDIDIDHINMTLSYCRQHLRLEPGEVLLLNCEVMPGGVQGRTIVPLNRLNYPDKLPIPEETYREFLVPLSAVLFREILKKDNLLPDRYRILFLQRRMATQATYLFGLLSLIGLGISAVNTAEIFSYQHKIDRMRQELTGLETVVANYENSSVRLQQIAPLLTMIQDARAMPDSQKALQDLSFLPLENVDIQGIHITNKRELMQMQFTGAILSRGFGEMHGTFQQLPNRLGKIPGIVVTAKTLDLKSRQFQITVERRIP